MTSEDRCYFGARGMCVGATSAHSNDGPSDISGPLLLQPKIAAGYMTSVDHCYYRACDTHAGAISTHNSDGPSDISGPLLLQHTVTSGVLTSVACRYIPQYLSKVVSLAMHSFSIYPTITLESVFDTQLWTPITHSLRSPSNTTSYSAILLVHLSMSLVNWRRAAYLNLMPEGEIRIAAAPTPVQPQAPSQYTCHGVSVMGPSV
jgi:hypothetical protein